MNKFIFGPMSRAHGTRKGRLIVRKITMNQQFMPLEEKYCLRTNIAKNKMRVTVMVIRPTDTAW